MVFEARGFLVKPKGRCKLQESLITGVGYRFLIASENTILACTQLDFTISSFVKRGPRRRDFHAPWATMAHARRRLGLPE